MANKNVDFNVIKMTRTIFASLRVVRIPCYTRPEGEQEKALEEGN